MVKQLEIKYAIFHAWLLMFRARVKTNLESVLPGPMLRGSTRLLASASILFQLSSPRLYLEE